MAGDGPGKDEARRALGLSKEALDALLAFRESGRPVTPGLIARALEALLRGQIALLARAEGSHGRAAPSAIAKGDDEVQPAVFEIQPIPPDSLEESGDLDMADLAKVERVLPRIDPPPPRQSRRRTPDGGIFKSGEAPLPEHTPPPIESPREAPRPAAPPPAPSEAGTAVRDAVEAVRAEALAAFPLEELNRWLASGTIFQIRGALAYLNLRSMGGARTDDLRANIRRMGFADELGKLVADGVAGDVLLFRKPA